MITVTFYGVRGSTPCPCDANHRYGGNTSCVALESPGREPIVFDLGTGLRVWGDTLADDLTFAGTALVTHIHWDHVQGLPFFSPALRPGARLDVYGPAIEGQTLAESFNHFIAPPYFPVRVGDLPGEITFHDLLCNEFAIGDVTVKSRPVPHVGPTLGYQVSLEGKRVTYISDHQMPVDDPTSIAPGVRELCEGVDLLIHDSQYTPEEFVRKSDWGHCTMQYAVHVAKECGVKQLALFHHDPAHDDTKIDQLLATAQSIAGDVEVIAASEGLTVVL